MGRKWRVEGTEGIILANFKHWDTSYGIGQPDTPIHSRQVNLVANGQTVAVIRRENGTIVIHTIDQKTKIELCYLNILENIRESMQSTFIQNR